MDNGDKDQGGGRGGGRLGKTDKTAGSMRSTGIDRRASLMQESGAGAGGAVGGAAGGRGGGGAAGVGKTDADRAKAGKLITAEHRDRGSLSFAVIQGYIAAMGGPIIFTFLMAGFFVTEAARLGASYWLSEWSAVGDGGGSNGTTHNGTHHNGTHPNVTMSSMGSMGSMVGMVDMGGMRSAAMTMAEFNAIPTGAGYNAGSTVGSASGSASGSSAGDQTGYYLGIYSGISCGQAIIQLVNQLALAWLGLKAGKVLHDGMLSSLFRAPMVRKKRNRQT